MPRLSIGTRTGTASRTKTTGETSILPTLAKRGPSAVPTASGTTGTPAAAANSAALAGESPALDCPSVSSSTPAIGWPG